MYNSDTHEIENLSVFNPSTLIDQMERAAKEKNPLKALLILLGARYD